MNATFEVQRLPPQAERSAALILQAPPTRLPRTPVRAVGRAPGTGRLTAVLALAALAAAFIFAVPEAAARIVVDDLGFKIEVQPNVHRVVSLVPSNSEMVCLLDCGRLKGGTRYDQFPEELKDRIRRKQIDVVGGGFDANLEKIVQLNPDLVLTNGPTQQRFAVPLKNMGYPVLSLWPRDLRGLTRDFLLLGELLAQENKARSIVAAMERAFRKIETRAQKQPKKRVYLQMWTDPLITVGKSSFPDWLVSVAGGINIFGDMPFDSGQISLESLIARDPEVLIFLADQKPFAKNIRERPGWTAIRGVQENYFCFIQEADIRRSVQFVGGLAKIHACLLGEAGADRPNSAVQK